jgi:cardiolipin synthase
VTAAQPDKVVADHATREPSPEPTDRVRRHLEGIIGVPATEGNAIDVLCNGDEIFPAMMDAVDQAQHTIDFLTFVYWEGSVGTDLAQRLAARATGGVRVRVLLDALGARTIDPTLIAAMERAGVMVRWFRPLRRFRPLELNHRTHRKVLIVDEEVGFTGGVGIAEEWLGDARNGAEWRDTHFRVRGPAVDGLRAAFLDNWVETDPVLFSEGTDRFPEQPQPGTTVVQCIRSASEIGWGDVDTLVRSLLQLATERLRITTAYFVPDPELTGRLCDAADRGVEVQILLPGPHADKRFVQLAAESMYGELLDHGVGIWAFQPSMLHAKIMTLDGLVSNIGSANLNTRSVAWDEEVNLVAVDHELTALLDDQFDQDLERSVRFERGRWEQRALRQRLAERAVTPLKRWF